MQPGNMPNACTHVSTLRRKAGCAPNTSSKDGVAGFVARWRHWRGRD